MRQRMLPLIIGAVVLLGIIVGAIYFQTRNDEAEVAGNAPTAPTGAPASAPSADAPSSGVTEPATNPNPDLTVSENGLSRATVVLVTSQGAVRFKFYSEDAPKTVGRLVELVNSGFYNGLMFHRVVPGFVVQGGDPEGTGRGGSGKNLKAEFNSRLHTEGTLAMARAADPDSADSQFYIALAPQPHLDRNYTVFGQVVEGMDVVRKIQIGDKIVRAYIE